MTALLYRGCIIISAVALYFAFKNVPLAELFRYLASINYLLGNCRQSLIALFSLALRACPLAHYTGIDTQDKYLACLSSNDDRIYDQLRAAGSS